MGDNELVSATPGELARAAARAPFTRRSRREIGYGLAGLVPAAAGFLLIVTLLTAGVLLTVTLIGTFVGLLVLVLTLRLARRLGSLDRRLAGRLLGADIRPRRRRSVPAAGCCAGWTPGSATAPPGGPWPTWC